MRHCTSMVLTMDLPCQTVALALAVLSFWPGTSPPGHHIASRGESAHGRLPDPDRIVKPTSG